MTPVARLRALTERLAALDGPADERGEWPDDLWSTLVSSACPSGRCRPSSAARAASGFRCSAVCPRRGGLLTAAFILSQHDAGVRRSAAASAWPNACHWLERIGAGSAFTTVGISHLTTGAPSLGAQPMKAVEVDGGYQVDGTMPWVTGAVRADVIVISAPLADGRCSSPCRPTGRAYWSVRRSSWRDCRRRTGEVVERVHLAGDRPSGRPDGR
ncbi:MAG: hypothetical protein U0835_10460 [Isosphaeraceae bacterium]